MLNRNRSCGGVVLLFYEEKEALERDAGEKERGRATLSREEASETLLCLTCSPNA